MTIRQSKKDRSRQTECEIFIAGKKLFMLLSVLVLLHLTACNAADSLKVADVEDLTSESGTPNPITTNPSGPISTPVPASGELTGTAALDEEEWAFITLINDYRALNGAPKLQVSMALTRASDWLSVEMASKNYFSHTDSTGGGPFTRMAEWGYPSNSSRAENIACGNATASATFSQWKNSSGHNVNMLNPAYKVIGIGRAYNAKSSYRWYWTTDFGSVVDATVK